MPSVHQQHLTATLLELADTLGDDYDLFDYLDVLLERSCAVVDAAAGGVMLDNGHGALEVMAATEERARLLELFEIQGREGPCLDAFRSGERVVADDLAGSGDWPLFTPTAVARGFAGVIALPLRYRDRSIGALNLFLEQSGSPELVQLQGVQALAQMAAIGILHERAAREARELSGQLQTALTSRVVIEQAKGILAERGGLDVGAAFDMLRTFCRNHNTRMRDTAAAIAAGELAADDVLAGQTPH